VPGIDIGVTDTTQATGIVGVDVPSLRPSSDEATTTTADPGTGWYDARGHERAKFPVRSATITSVSTTSTCYVTAGAGTTSWTVTRNASRRPAATAAGVSHSIGATVNS
jgi:hypothetical protein